MSLHQIFICIVLTTSILFGAESSRIVSGSVLDQAGKPAPQVKVSVRDSDSPKTARATTGSDGRFSVAVDFRRYEVTVEAPDLVLHLDLGDSGSSITVEDRLNYQAPLASATRMPIPLLNTPQSVAVVTRELMDDQGMQSLADVVRSIPGVTMALGEGHRDAPVIRGNQTTADLFVNGVRDDVQYYRDLYNLERVEAVKGANAMTFGRGGGGGILNRVTKDANYTAVRAITLEGGMFGKKRATADFGGTWKERLSFRLNGMYEDSGTFRRYGNLERYGIAPALSWMVSPSTQLKVNYEYFSDARVVDRGIPSFNGRPLAVDWRTFFGDPQASHSAAGVHLGTVRLVRQMGAWNWRSTFQAADYDKFYQNIFPGAVTGDLVSLSGYNTGTLRRNWFGQSDLSGTFRTGWLRHTLLTGTELGRQQTENVGQTAYFGSATSRLVPIANPALDTGAVFRPAATDADNVATNRTAAAFLQDQIQITKFLQLLAGVRYDYFTIGVTNRRTLERTARPDHMVSPRLGLVLKPVAQLSLYGSYSVTFLPSAGDQFSSLSVSQQTLRPEKFTNLEAGIKWDIHRSLSFASAVYRLDRANSTARDPIDVTRLVQTGRQRTNGVEASLTGSLTRRWTTTGAFAVQDAVIASATTAAPAGAKVALVPGRTFSLWNHYRVTSRWSAGAGWIAQAHSWAAINNTVRLPGFWRMDLASSYSLTERLRLQGNLENVLNTGYIATAHTNNNIFPGAPRSLRLSLSMRF